MASAEVDRAPRNDVYVREPHGHRTSYPLKMSTMQQFMAAAEKNHATDLDKARERLREELRKAWVHAGKTRSTSVFFSVECGHESIVPPLLREFGITQTGSKCKWGETRYDGEFESIPPDTIGDAAKALVQQILSTVPDDRGKVRIEGSTWDVYEKTLDILKKDHTPSGFAWNADKSREVWSFFLKKL